jgi:hypothetical protein
MKMKTPKITWLVVAVAGIAILSSGCGSTDYRTQWAQNRCDQVMAQARMEAVQELLAEGRTDHAQKMLEQYLPETAHPMTSDVLLAAEEDEDDKEQPPSQYARVTLEEDLEAQEQAW